MNRKKLYFITQAAMIAAIYADTLFSLATIALPSGL